MFNRRWGVLLLLFALGWFCQPSSVSALEDSIVAVVNDSVITLKDLKDYMNSAVVQMRMEGAEPAEIEAVLAELEADGIRKLIEEKVILTKADEMGIEVNPKAVDGKLDEIKAKYPTENDFLNALLADGASVTDLRRKIENQLKIQFLIDQEVRSNIRVNPQDVTEYYEKHPQEFLQPEQLKLDSLYLQLGPDAGETQALAQDILARLKAGEDFRELCDKYSDAPSIGTVKKGELLPEVEEELFTLEPGQLSSVIEVDGGLYIFRVKQKIPEQASKLEDVKAQISRGLYDLKFRMKIKDWLEELKDDSYIEIKG